MQSYWIKFTDGSKGCCDGQSEHDATHIAEHIKKKKVESIDILPYPASPTIWQFEHPVNGKCPTFCYTPEKCKGKTCCPNSPCCTS